MISNLNKITFIVSLIFAIDNANSEFILENSGHLKLKATLVDFNSGSLQEDIGPKTGGLHDYNFRYNLKAKNDNLLFNIEAESNGIGGSSLRPVNSFIIGRPLLENDKTRAVNLTIEQGDTNFLTTNRIDRLFLQYSNENLSISAGRQAISFGQGIVFPVLDIFIPFSPLQFDREYKPGEDLAKLSYNINSNLSTQSIIIARRDESENLSSNSGSYLLIGKYEQDSYDIHLLAGQHFDRLFSGISTSYVINEYVIRSDISLFETDSGANKSDFLINIDRGITVAGFESYIFIEYYHNALGVHNSDYNIENSDLEPRLRRGEIFSLGRNYLAPGFRLNLTERISANMVNIFSLEYKSFAIRPLLVFDPNDNLRFRFGFSKSIGDSNTEFGGIKLTDLPNPVSPIDQIFLQASYYF